MGDEGERVGGIYVDIGLDDAGVIERLNAIESALSSLAKREVTVKVKLVEDGSTTPTRAKKTVTEIPASLKVEKDAAKKAVKQTDPVNVPVSLSLANDAISKLKTQITEAFQNFSIKVNVEYGGGTPSQAQQEFAEATGLGGGGSSRTKRLTRSSGPRVQSEAPVFDRFYAVAKNASLADEIKKSIGTLKQDPNATQGMLNRFTGTLNTIERRIRVLSATPAGTLSEEQPQAAERPLVERVRRVQKRSATRPKRLIQRPADQVAAVEEVISEPIARTIDVPLPTSTRTGRRRPMQNANDDPRLAAIEAAQRRQDREAAMLSGRSAADSDRPNRRAPRGGPDREFDRTPLTPSGFGARSVGVGPIGVVPQSSQIGGELVDEPFGIHGPGFVNARRRRLGLPLRRRQGPARTFAQDPTAGRSGTGFFEPRPANQVGRFTDENALGVLDPAAFDIMEKYRKGLFGTTEDPMVETLDQEGKRVGKYAEITDPQRRQAVREAGSTAYGTVFGGGRRRIVAPKTLAKEALAGLGELSPLVKQKIFGTGVETDRPEERGGLFANPRYRPGSGIINGSPGYQGVSEGSGGAARSINDTPEGNAANRARVQTGLYQDALRKLRDESPDIAAAVEQLPQNRRRKFLRPFTEQYGDVVQQRALMKAAPREFGFDQTRLTAAFSRFQKGFAGRQGLEGYLGEDAQVTPASTYNAFVRKFLDEYKAEFQPTAKRLKVPEQIKSLLAGQSAKVRETTGTMVPDYERFSATGGAGKRFVPGTIEEAANRIEPPGRQTTKSRDRRRSYTPAEEQLAEIRSRLQMLEGTPETIRTATNRGTTTEVPGAYGLPELQHIPGSPGTAEEQRSARQGGATRVGQRRLGEIETSRLLLREVQARAARKIKAADEIRAVITGQLSPVEDPSKARALYKRFRGYGLDIPEGSGLPGGVLGGIDVAPAANIGEARSRLARALVRQRGYRRMLPATYAAADQERQELVGRGVQLDAGPVISDKTPLSGDELRARVSGSPIVGRTTKIANLSPRTNARIAAKVEAAAPIPEETLASVIAIRAKADARVLPEQAARRAAEGREPRVPIGGGPGTALGPSGAGPIQVHVVNFSELKGMMVTGGGGKGGPLKAAEGGTPALTEEEKAAASAAKSATEAAKLRAASQAQLVKRIQQTNPEFKLAEPERAQRTGKSAADIEAEAQILQARSLNPTRAFQTAIAAGFAKTIGGGGAFEERVKTLTGTITARRGVQGQLESSAPQYRATAASLRDVNKVLDDLDTQYQAQLASGKQLTPAQKALVNEYDALRISLGEQFDEEKATRQSLIKRRGGLDQEIKQQQSRLISPGGVVRGFAALGAGAIAGGLIFGAASQGIQAALSLLEENAAKAADILGGFAATTNQVVKTLAGAFGPSAAAGRAGVAAAAAQARLGPEGFAQVAGPLSQRAGAIAGREAIGQRADLLNAARNITASNQQFGGYDQSLFRNQGGFNVQSNMNGSYLSRLLGINDISIGGEGSFAEKLEKNLIRPGFTSAATINRMSARAANPNPDNGPLGINKADNEKFAAEIAEKLKIESKSLDSLNETLKGSEFKLTRDAGDLAGLEKQFQEAVSAGGPSGLFGAFKETGIKIEGLDPTDIKSIGKFLDTLAGQNQSPQVQLEADRPAIEAQVRQVRRDAQHQLDFTVPSQQALENLAAPPTPVGTGISGRKDEQSTINAGLQQANDLQAELDKRYEAGNAILAKALPADLLSSIKTTGAAIAGLQADISNQQADLSTHEYNNQLRIAERTLSDISGLTGKNYGYGKSQIGVIEKQNFELSKQSQLLAQQLAQRQINFQLATAGFIVAGQSPEERAARIKDAKTQAEFAQKQLDIQKKQTANQFKLFDLNNVRAATDALASIALLKEGRSVNINTKIAEEKLIRLQKLQADNVKKAGVYLNKIEAEVAIASAEITKLEIAYGKAIDDITRKTINGFILTLEAVYAAVLQTNKILTPTFGSGGVDNNPNTPYATGVLGEATSATGITVGEAGKETVAILRNARNVSATGFGGGGITININNPVVREENDIRKITQSVISALNTRTALLGLR